MCEWETQRRIIKRGKKRNRGRDNDTGTGRPERNSEEVEDDWNCGQFVGEFRTG